jgi:hypothetical protein
MYERFTDRARKVLQMANQEAQVFNHEYIGTEHILLGLVKEGSGVAANVLKNLDIDLRRIRLEVEKLVQSGPDEFRLSRRFQTPRAKKAIQYAMEEAWALKHNYVGTEHILLGLLRENEGVAAQILMGFGLRLEGLRAEIENLLGRPTDREGEPPAIRAVEQPANETAALPKACPKCGQPVVRVIWGWVHLFGRELEDVQAGRAILASPVEKGGPPWVCLQCSPKWSEVHSVALREHELQVEKENAIVARDFEKAAQCRDRQTEVRRRLISLLDELSGNQ